MEVLNQRSALLSNYEVLTLLRELESDHLANARTALKIKKEEDAAGNSTTRSHAASQEVIENLRTIEVEAIQYLSANYQPTSSQSETAITQLTRNLAAYDLTKAEKLQIVNLAPVEPVELYVIVEELEDRFGEQIDDMISTVRASLTNAATNTGGPDAHGHGGAGQAVYNEEALTYDEDAEGWEPDIDDNVFDDHGEGMGVEGDLDMEED